MAMVYDKAFVKTLKLIKTTDSYEQNTKNLENAHKYYLKATYAFLLRSSTDDRVKIFKVDGLRMAIMAKLLCLMPKFCGDCQDKMLYYAIPRHLGEVMYIRCKNLFVNPST